VPGLSQRDQCRSQRQPHHWSAARRALPTDDARRKASHSSGNGRGSERGRCSRFPCCRRVWKREPAWHRLSGIRRLLRRSSSRPDGALLRPARTHGCPKKPPEFTPRGVSLMNGLAPRDAAETLAASACIGVRQLPQSAPVSALVRGAKGAFTSVMAVAPGASHPRRTP
jgi:hypothetical protein